MKLLTIDVHFEYPVYFTRDVFDRDNDSLARAIRRKEPERRHRAMLVLDRGVVDSRPESWRVDIRNYFARHAIQIVEEVVLDGGEAVKNDTAALDGILSRIHQHALDRQSFVIIVGGGAVLDLAGHAAGIAHRGIRVVRLPTTVLSQADSGVGVKAAINAFGKKNFLGTFSPPFAVLNDVRFLETLTRRDAIAGMSEAVKVSLIRDRAFFEWLDAHTTDLAARENAAVAEVVRRSAELHLAHIATSGDPFEMGSARPLDFGHWAAHKLESLTHHRLRHGEAVAIGIAIDAFYSAAGGLCSEEVAGRVLATLRGLGFSLWDDAMAERRSDGKPRLLEGLEEFREHLGGELTLTMLRDIGRGEEIHEVDERLVLASIERLRHSGASAGTT